MPNQLYQHILVPLDGSDLAEAALVEASHLARLMKAKLTLLQAIHLIEPGFGANTFYPVYPDKQWIAQKRRARDYLNEVAQRLSDDSQPIDIVVKIGPAAEAIIDYASDNAIDLIVMSSHGRSGFDRWVYGSVTDKVLRNSNKPMLLIRSFKNNQNEGTEDNLVYQKEASSLG